jgi:hypothetical protein
MCTPLGSPQSWLIKIQKASKLEPIQDTKFACKIVHRCTFKCKLRVQFGAQNLIVALQTLKTIRP